MGDSPAGNDLKVEICDTQSLLDVDAERLAGLARRVLEAQGIRRASISLALVDNRTSQRVNRDHLGHDWPTDVISFRLSDPADPELAGELIVSAEMARATAAEISADPWAELALYVVHGVLHMCGYDDHTDESAQVMRNQEDQALRHEGLCNTFALPALIAAEGTERERAACSD
jgi:probable rRNA maturation factor